MKAEDIDFDELVAQMEQLSPDIYLMDWLKETLKIDITEARMMLG